VNPQKNKTSSVSTKLNEVIDSVEKIMLGKMLESGEFELIDCPLKHFFTNGLYCRQITMKPGARITSKIHLTEHQFLISQGIAIVYDGDNVEVLTAGHHGITKAGTRRVLIIPDGSPEPCIWTTVHPNPNNENLQQIEDRIIEKHDNLLLNDNEKKFLKLNN
jgi:mannose-6-phosphate isomerase-like protein (cupin superfamily)